jgi:hypothetical protein
MVPARCISSCVVDGRGMLQHITQLTCDFTPILTTNTPVQTFVIWICFVRILSLYSGYQPLTVCRLSYPRIAAPTGRYPFGQTDCSIPMLDEIWIGNEGDLFQTSITSLREQTDQMLIADLL